MKQFYDNLMDYEGTNVFDDVLQPVMHMIKDTVSQCEVLKTFDASIQAADIRPELEAFFALSVCHDYLISTPLLISQQQYCAFYEEIGFELDWYQDTFNPVLHEIIYIHVEDKQSFQRYFSINGATHSQVNTLYYPTVRFGQLIFARGGCYVMCTKGTGMVKDFAINNTLYFSNQRHNRPCSDLSHGWGSNSRWGTSFERFYELEDRYLLNVDGKYDISNPKLFNKAKEGYDVTLHEAKEILMHRCLVSSPDKELFPFDWRLAIKKEPDFWLNPTALKCG